MSLFQTVISLTALIASLISLGNSFFTTDDWIAVFGKGNYPRIVSPRQRLSLY